LIANFLHHFDPPTCATFMRKVHAALKPSGRAAIVDLVSNPDRAPPSTATVLSMMMLATTPAGDTYAFAVLESISKCAGFAQLELAPPEIGLDRLVIALNCGPRGGPSGGCTSPGSLLMRTLGSEQEVLTATGLLLGIEPGSRANRK